MNGGTTTNTTDVSAEPSATETVTVTTTAAAAAPTPGATKTVTVTKVKRVPGPTVRVTVTAQPKAASKPEPPVTAPTAPTGDLTAAQENAIGSARDYLGYTAFSRSGLIEQLTSQEHFSSSAASANCIPLVTRCSWSPGTSGCSVTFQSSHAVPPGS